MRNLLNGDVYIFMDASRTTMRIFHFENHVFCVHEKHYVEGYKFLDIQTCDSGMTYYIIWEDLLSVLETSIIKKIRLGDETKTHYKNADRPSR